jgi:hypothetical protein
MKSVSSKTAVKARAYNMIRKLLYKKVYKLITPAEKEQLFRDIFEINLTHHSEIRIIDWKKREKARINKARVARGYVPKKRMTRAEWETSKQWSEALVKKTA